MSAPSRGTQGQTLEVTVVACERLLNREYIGLMDPYVDLEYGGIKYRTRTCKDGGQNPAFGDRFLITLVDGYGEIDVSVWNRNTFRPRDFIGHCRIQLNNLILDVESVWQLLTKSSRYAGDLRLLMSFGDAINRRQPSPPPAASYTPYPAPNY